MLTFASGCSLFHDPAIDEGAIVRESSLAAAELEERIAAADELWAEPRTVDRVQRALDICLESASPKNDWAALWRAARCAYWLAGHHPDEERRREYALTGAHLGAAAVERTPARPEAHYFHALNLGLLSRLEGRGVRRVPLMAERARRVIELDEAYEHAGGRRFLGILCFNTMNNPLVAIGTIDDAMDNLRRACEIAPAYGGNQLAYAEVLLADERLDEARQRLERVLASPLPPDDSELHREWIARARELIREHFAGEAGS